MEFEGQIENLMALPGAHVFGVRYGTTWRLTSTDWPQLIGESETFQGAVDDLFGQVERIGARPMRRSNEEKNPC